MDTVQQVKAFPISGGNAVSPWVCSAGKRAFDLVLASLFSVVALPAVILISVALKLNSRGPVFFLQERLGKNAVPFSIVKFRSMHQQVDLAGPSLTQTQDTRLTSVGRWLRHWKLDELPQIWNVLKGDMSLVGPRPHLAALLTMHEPRTLKMLRIKPGITGLSAIAFRHEQELLEPLASEHLEEFYLSEVLPVKTQLDLQYMRDASLALDIKLLWHTVRCVFTSPAGQDG